MAIPAELEFEPAVFEHFLQMLPRDTFAAAELAAGHDARVKVPSFTVRRKRRLRHAIESATRALACEAFIRLLRNYGAALLVSDAVAGWPYVEDVTADFVYLRLHGPETLYGGSYQRRGPGPVGCPRVSLGSGGRTT